jgi:hypothetical protein
LPHTTCNLVFIGLIALLRGLPMAQSADSPVRTAHGIDTASDDGASKPLRFETGHGFAYGQGRKTYNGAHVLDSVSLTLKQTAGPGTFSENVAANSNKNLQNKKKPDGEADLSLGYKRGGFSLGAVGGAAYESILFSKITRQEKEKPKSALLYHYGLTASEAFSLDADSTWDLDLGASYDDLGAVFRTADLSAGITKTIGDFDLEGTVTGFTQKQDEAVTVCATKKKNAACTDSTETGTTRGFGLSAEADWDLDPHEIDVKAGMDWQLASDTQRTVLLGIGYAFSAASWIDLGVYLQSETDLDVKKNAEFWLAGNSVNLHF